jgi:hypothetical protein
MASSQSVTLSLRVPNELKTRLEKVAARTQRSRAYLTIAALEKHLDEVEKDELQISSPGVYDIAMRYRSAAAKIIGRTRSAEEIDALIRELRDDD